MILFSQIKDILSDRRRETTESLAREAQALTEQYFGRTISLYAPIYISNYCSSWCTYCGFHSHNRIQRFKLTAEEMRREMSFLAGEGIENALILTGESYNLTPPSYLKEAVGIAREFFPSVSLEVHPMTTAEYRDLFEEGVDGITVYQETYDRKRYAQVHLTGTKADYDFRYGTPERAAQGGVRSIAMGILLGLSEVAQDLTALYAHLRSMEKRFPGVEYSVSFPRLKPIKGKDFASCPVDDVTFLKIICLTRLLFPRVGINLSTREGMRLRDNCLGLGVTRMSAGSNTSVGGYTLRSPEEQDPQFDVEDRRRVAEIVEKLKARNFDPVLTDWRRIPNGVTLP